MNASETREIGPWSIIELLWSALPARAMVAALERRVFAALEAGEQSAVEVARRVEADPRGIRMLLDMLATMGYLENRDGRYALTPLARDHLIPGKPGYLGDFATGMLRRLDHWERLAEVVRSGKPLMAVEEQEAAEQFFPGLVRALHICHTPLAERLAGALARQWPSARVLDVACGTAVWGIHHALADAQARVTAHDFPGLLDLAREYAERHGVGDRFDYLPGDLKTVEFGAERYDLALLGNICHSEGEVSSRDLLRRLTRALRPGGAVAIIDMIPNEQRTGPPFPVLFALNMLLVTRDGGTYTLGEYTAWAREAGLGRVETVDIGSHSPVIVASRA